MHPALSLLLLLGVQAPTQPVAWVEAMGLCTNVEEVARAAFGDTGEVWALASWEVLNLADGVVSARPKPTAAGSRLLLSIVPSHGAGMCPGFTSVHFEVVEGRCREVFTGADWEYLVEEPWINGYPQLHDGECATEEAGETQHIETVDRRWFWRNGRFVHAWTKVKSGPLGGALELESETWTGKEDDAAAYRAALAREP